MYVLQLNCMNLSQKKFKLINVAFQMIEKQGWQKFSLKRLADEKKISIVEVNQIFRKKEDILKEFSSMIDLQVEKNFDFRDLENSSTKDNLFELIMLRLELMRPYKKALTNIILAFRSNLSMIKSVSFKILNSLDFYLELTNAYDGSFFDIFKKKVILFIYTQTFVVWINDDSEEMSKTMSELDKMLSFSEKITNSFKDYFPI